MIDSKYDFYKSFQEFLDRTDNSINEGSGWVVGSVDAEYMCRFFYLQSIIRKEAHSLNYLVN